MNLNRIDGTLEVDEFSFSRHMTPVDVMELSEHRKVRVVHAGSDLLMYRAEGMDHNRVTLGFTFRGERLQQIAILPTIPFLSDFPGMNEWEYLDNGGPASEHPVRVARLSRTQRMLSKEISVRMGSSLVDTDRRHYSWGDFALVNDLHNSSVYLLIEYR